jgi:hypothetical protein
MSCILVRLNVKPGGAYSYQCLSKSVQFTDYRLIITDFVYTVFNPLAPNDDYDILQDTGFSSRTTHNTRWQIVVIFGTAFFGGFLVSVFFCERLHEKIIGGGGLG